MTWQESPRSREELGELSRADLISIYQRHLFHDAYEAVSFDRDYLIEVILEMEDQPEPYNRQTGGTP